MIVNKIFNHIDVEFKELNVIEEDGQRLYDTPKGNLVSVTTVTGWRKSLFFAEWRKHNPKEASRVTHRGNKLHTLIEHYINNEFSPDDAEHKAAISPDTLELFLQLQPELDKIDNVYAQEVPLFSEALGLAGRVDCVAEYDGKLSIIDFKGSTRSKRKSGIKNYFLQATAYAIMWQEMTGTPIDNFAILISCEDGKVQVFEGRPLDYVRDLKDCIDDYKTNSGQFKLT